MISPTSTNYTGRKVDLNCFSGISVPNQPVAASFGLDPQVIAGIGMVAQNFIRILLTPLGFYPSDPSLGSNLLSKLFLNQTLYPSDVVHAFAIESSRVIDFMRANETSVLPDENIASATLLSYRVQPTSVSLQIEIETKAGSTVSFLLPVNMAVI